MFEFQKICNDIESLDAINRGILLTDKSISVIKGLNELNLPGVHPVDALVAFIIGSVISDGSISEKDYLYIYPSLVKAFGEVCDIVGIKNKIKVSKDIKKEVENYTKELISVIAEANDELASDIAILCLLITSVDGKISLKEKRYLKQLCKN